ncbi:MAG: TetR/AcrR family transcriptional regulator C-terminal domain-containing protein [bacterium]
MTTQTRNKRRGPREMAMAREAPSREALTQARVMAGALKLIDGEGLDALSMRRLGAELGVEAMSLYRHVDGKEALLDGLSAQLWSEVRLPDERASEWKVAVGETARSLRELARGHPNSFSLLLGRPTLSEPALRVFDAMLRTFRDAKFSKTLASQALGTLVAYAVGYAMVEITCGLGQPELAARRCITPDAAGRFSGVSEALAECDPDALFDFGLEALLRGLDAKRRSRSGRRRG